MQCQKCWSKNALGIGPLVANGRTINTYLLRSHGGRNKRIHSEKGSISVINE